MMTLNGVRIQTRGSIEHRAQVFRPRIMRGLRAIHLLNDSLEKACHNYAPGGRDASVVGAPTVNAQALSCPGANNYLASQVAESRYMSIYSIVRTAEAVLGSDPTTKPMFYGTYTAPDVAGVGDTYGVSLYASDPAGIVAMASRGTSIDDDAPAGAALPANLEQFALYSHIIRPTVTILGNETEGTYEESNGPQANGPRRLALANFRIGAGYQPTEFAGDKQVALWWAYDVDHSDDERQLVLEDIRRYAATRLLGDI